MASRLPDEGEPQNDETAALLASLGSSVTSMDKYESSVLRQAAFDAAPTLMGKGFPDLAPLAPSYDPRRGLTNGSADLPHVQTLLSRVRSQLTQQQRQPPLQQSPQEVNLETHQSLVLRLKEQILLSFLQEVVKLPAEDMPVQPLQESAAEQKRSMKLIRAIQNASMDSNESPRNRKRKVQTSDHVSTRLESIKQDGTMARDVTSASTTGSFGKQSLLEREQRFSKRRIPLMEQKEVRVDETDEETVQRRALLRQKRNERLERKRKRRERWVKEAISDESDREIAFDDETGETNGEGESVEESNNQTEEEHFVICPICDERIKVSSEQALADATLSEHMNLCQRRPRRTRRRVNTENEAKNAATSIRTSPRVAARKISAVPKDRRPSQPSSSSKIPLDDLQEWDYEDRVDNWIESGVSKMREMDERDQNETAPGADLYPGGLTIPAWINNRLFPYQRTGTRWMWELHMQDAGGIVGDEMGLGKTVQICAFLGAMAASRKLNSILVICPATMLQHWLKELSIWAPGLRRVMIHKSGELDGLSRSVTPSMLQSLEKWLRKARANCINEPIDDEDRNDHDEKSFCGTGYVVVTTYENIRRSPNIWTGHSWSYAVMDEGQKIRNPDADVTLSCKRIRTPHRLLLSGTPIQNDLRELWSLFDFVFPGRLGTLPAFEAEFAEPIRRGGYSNASPMQVQLAYRCALMLKDLINPYLLRRQKKDILEVQRMPGKTEQVLFCRLSNRQRALYEAYIRSDAVVGILRGSTQLLSAITVLRKICNHPDLVCSPDNASFESFVRNGCNNQDSVVDSSGDDDEEIDSDESMVERSGKLEVLAKILPLWRKQGHRVLIFCQWTKMLSIIQKFTQLQGWKFGRLDGSTNVASRQNLVDTFNNDESYFGMLMTTRTGGVGLNLTGADRIILYDPDWNPQTDAQARERAWRFGQKNAVTVYRLITAGTIEEKIYQRQIFKTALTNKVLEDPRQRRLFSQRDLKDFFTLKADIGSVASGGHGFTETGEITKGAGVVDPDEAGADDLSDDDGTAVTDDVDTLQNVLQSKGLAGVFDHDAIGNSSAKKSAAIREMEENAKRVAREAAKALRESASTAIAFQPTWTGTNETQAHRFRGEISQSSSSSTSNHHPDQGFGGAGTAGVARTMPTLGGTASSFLLANLRKRNNPSIETAAVSNGDVSQYTELMKRIRDFVRLRGGLHPGCGPTTNDILKEFESVPSSDAAIFRRLLNSVATVEKGHWRLKES